MVSDRNDNRVAEVLKVRDSLVQELSKRAKRMEYLSMNFPDVNSIDFNLPLNQWVPLPDSISSGVKVKALVKQLDWMELLVKYQPGGYITPHYHSCEDEIIEVKSGQIEDRLNSLVFGEGETYQIQQGVRHHIVSTFGAELFIVFQRPSLTS